MVGSYNSTNTPIRDRVKHRQAERFHARPRADVPAPFIDTVHAAIAYAAIEERENNNKLTMEISREQREGFMRLLQEAKAKRHNELQRELEKKVKDELLPRIMQRQGIVKLVENVKQIGHQLSESAQKLQGMDVFGQPATLWGKILGTNEGIEELVEKMKRPYTEQADAALRDYDHALLQVLSATTLEDAQRIVNNLI